MTAWLRRSLSRLVHLVRPGRAEAELDRELASHLALLEDDLLRRGVPKEEAARAARLALGGVERTKDLHRDERSFVFVEDAVRDAAFAVRLLRRNGLAAATAALSLAIGIGANTAVFSVVNALLFRAPIGVSEPSRLVDVGISRPDGGFEPGSYPTYLDLRREVATLDGVYARHLFPQALSLGRAGAGAAPERVFGQFVTTNFFTVLGARAAAGRLFSPADGEQPGASPIVVLSDEFWRRRFGADPAVLTRTISLNGRSVDVVGVAPEGFHGTGVLAADVWLPLSMVAAVGSEGEGVFTNRASGWLVMGGRLRPGVSAARAAAEVEALGRDLDRAYPDPTGARGLQLLPSSSVPGNRGVVTGFLLLLMGLASLVLCVACANVSGVLLARGAARRREIAVRVAIGAGRARLVRQLLMETILLFAIGGAGGLALARGMTSLLVARLPALPFPIALTVVLDGRVVAFTAGLSLVAALVSGLAPALQASGADPVATLKNESQGPSDRGHLRHAFVVAQVAASVALVIGAGMFVRAIERAGSLDPGFDPHGVELAPLDLSMAGHTATTGPLFWRELIDRVRLVPGVQEATLARVVPGGFEGLRLGLTAAGAPPANRRDSFVPDGNIVEPGYFATLRIPLLAGRDFSADDRAGTQPVAIVGEAAARHFWPGANAVGQFLSQRGGGPSPGAARTLLVVGVARDVKSTSLVDGLSQSFVYLPLQQQQTVGRTSRMTIVTRSDGSRPVAEAIRSLVASLDPNLPIVTSQTLEDSIVLGLVPQRVAASVAGTLGVVGWLLAGIGIYGVTAFAVTRRLREFGIRIALGAGRADIVRMVVGQGLWLALVGCAVGVALAAAGGHVLSGFLFGAPPFDPALFGAAAVLAAAIAAAACLGPARRATRKGALIALRHD
jgi:predicted permease